MRSRLLKIIIPLFFIFLAGVGIAFQQGFDYWENQEQVSSESESVHSEQNNNLQVDFFDVGQGDAILIRTPNNKKILIDGGPDNTVLNHLGESLDFFDNQIDVMILTHPHADHVVGLVEVVKRYDIKQVYYTGVVHTTSDYLEWLAEIQAQQIPLAIVEAPFNLQVEDDLVLEFLYPQTSFLQTRVDELNNTSIVNRLVYQEIEFLLMGDAEVEVEQELLSAQVDLSADVLKVGHHGSSSSSLEEFLLAVDPQYSVIMCGTDNEFGHPHLITLKRLERLGIKILRTDLDGTISFISDGQSVELLN